MCGQNRSSSSIWILFVHLDSCAKNTREGRERIKCYVFCCSNTYGDMADGTWTYISTYYTYLRLDENQYTWFGYWKKYREMNGHMSLPAMIKERKIKLFRDFVQNSNLISKNNSRIWMTGCINEIRIFAWQMAITVFWLGQRWSVRTWQLSCGQSSNPCICIAVCEFRK